jgi:N-acetylglutamate synthase-like GNAT family acetyltransferase
MLKLRRYLPSDLEAVSRIWEKHHSQTFSLPALNPSIITGVIVDENDKVVAFGNLKIYAEGVIVMDHDRPKATLGRALKKLMEAAIMGARKFGVSRIHVSTTDPDYSEILRKHYGFSDVLGEHLVREND